MQGHLAPRESLELETKQSELQTSYGRVATYYSIASFHFLFKNKQTNKKPLSLYLYLYKFYIQQFTLVKYCISYTTLAAMGDHEAKL